MTQKSVEKIDQSNAKAGGNIVAGDQINIAEQTNVYNSVKRSKVDTLIAKLKAEIEGDSKAKEIIDELQSYHQKYSSDGIDGLEEKLTHANRSFMIPEALRCKEAFSKKLEKYTHYISAQEIFAFLLSKVEVIFNSEIRDMLGEDNIGAVNSATKEKIFDPIMEELCDDIMMLDYRHVQGMLYWLAEQCFIRWHK